MKSREQSTRVNAKLRRAAFLLALLSLLCFSSDLNLAIGATPSVRTQPSIGTASSESGSQPVPQRAPTKFALLVGINNYQYPDRISPLAGSINDVEDMRQVLIGKFEFPPENILVLEDAQATHAGIINALETHLIAQAQAGDVVVFHFSGHGSQMKDVTGKKINNLEETIVPYDSRDPDGKVFDIPGSELHAVLVKLAAKTKNVTFILDSCHSGTLVRGARVRGVAADTRTPPPGFNAASESRGVAGAAEDVTPKFVSIAAASSRESAFEHFAEGKDHGALTYFLARQLRSAKAGVTYRDIMDSVSGNITANYPAQHASLEGAEADQYVFGDGSSLARAYVSASPSLLDARRVTLAIGQVQGATVGSTYEIYPPGSKKFALPEKPVAKVQLLSVNALTSEATLVSGVKPAPASRAVEREHQYGTSRIRILLDGLEQSPALQSIKEALQSVPYIEFVDKASMCNFQVRQAGGKIQTLGADSTTLSTPIAADDPAVVDRAVAQIKSWAKWFSILSIRNVHPDIELKFTLQGSQTRDPMARVGKPDMGVRDGEVIEAILTNNADRDVYIAILDLSSDGSISVVYPPEQGAMEVLKPGMKLTKSLTTFVPKGRQVVTDILKVFASYKPINLTPVTQGSIRGMEAADNLDPLQQLLTDATESTRGVAPVLNRSLDLSSWATTQATVMVKHSN